MSALAELLARYAEGATDAAEALLDEVEPSLYGYARSLLVGADCDPAPAVAHAHALTLAFHLRALAGTIDADSNKGLRGLCHRWVLARLADENAPHPASLAGEDGTARWGCISVAWTLEEELSANERLAYAARLAGEDGGPHWEPARAKLEALGLVLGEQTK